MEQKIQKHGDTANLGRNIDKMRDALGEDGFPDGGGGRVQLVYENPMGQSFKDTRTDLDATISGTGTDDLVVVEVIKPVIRAVVGDGISRVVQRGVVVVESRKGAVTP